MREKRLKSNNIISNEAKKCSGYNDKKRECQSYKYSNKGKSSLHEAIILSGSSIFIKYENDGIVCVDQIEESDRTIRPPYSEEYPYEPYEFANIEELKSYVKKAKTETIDSLYLWAKSIVTKYNDQDSPKLILLAADVVWSYFQDKFSTTHYVTVIGDNGSGKSTIGDTFEAVAYRVVSMTDPSAANLFRILGTLEPGQCTLVADEAEKIDQSPEIMSTLKTGYQFKSKVARVNMNTGKQEFYYPYCLKIIIAERSPDEMKAKGVLDRTFVLNTYNGTPKYDIKEAQKPAGNANRQTLLEELVDFRKVMLVYRVLHSEDPIEDIDIGIQGRHKELCKPMIQLFHNTKSNMEIQAAFQKFLDEKNQRKINSLEAALHPIIVNLVSTAGRELSVARVWNSILETIPGTRDEKKPNEFQSYDFGIMYRNTITNIMCDKFGAERSHRRNGTVLTFDHEKLVRVGNLYNLETKIQTKIGDGEGGDSGEGSGGGGPISQKNNVGEGGDSGEGSGEDRPISAEQTNPNNKEFVTVAATTTEDSIKMNNNNNNSSDLVGCFWPNRHPQSSVEPSQPSQPSPQDNRDTAAVAKSIYRIHAHSDIFACNNCRLTGDKWEMRQHPCNGSKK